MSELAKKYQHIVVVIGTVVTLILAIYSRVFAYGELNNRVESQEKQIIEVKTDLQGKTSKSEFELMKDAINRIDQNVATLNKYLLNKK